jgi:recombination protein RecA
MAKSEKEKALDLAVAQIEKEFGKGSIMKLGENQAKMTVGAIQTGILSLDLAIGIGGVPRGRIIELYGPESSGKTTLSLNVISNAQKDGGIAAFIDAEHAMDPVYAKKLGVDIDNLLISQPDDGEQAMEIAETLVRSGAIDVIVIDSVAALVPRAEIEGDMDQMQVGLQARLMSKALRKLTAAVSKSKTCLIFINQLREKIGIMYGNPETTPGGRALKFYSSLRMEIRRVSTIKNGDINIGNRVKVKISKNKVAPPFKETEFDMLYDKGILVMAGLIDAAVTYGIVDRTGTWYLFGETRLGQGRDNAREYLEQNLDLAKKIEKAVKDKFFNPVSSEEKSETKKSEKSEAKEKKLVESKK